MKKSSAVLILLFGLAVSKAYSQTGDQKKYSNTAFTLQTDKYGIGGLWKTDDVHPTNYIRKGRVFGDVTVRYARGKIIDTVTASTNSNTTFTHEGNVVSSWSPKVETSDSLAIFQSFALSNNALTWNIQLQNTSAAVMRIEDLAIPFFYNAGGGENPKEIFEERVIKHHFISGNNSFIFWERPTGVGPYLVMVHLTGTSLEYFTTNTATPGERGVFQAFIHSALTGNRELRGNWRQPHSFAMLPGKQTKTYGFKFRWANDYNGIRDILAEEGLIDVKVMPGMTVPNDLEATIALRTHQKINNVIAEFAPLTNIKYLGEKQKGTHLYKIKFFRLGENKLTINYGDNFKTYLEFFVTEPLETLYKKRASFIVNSQQIKDHSKWYDGLFGPYDMKNASLRSPDNPDYFDTSRLSYILTCDDPGLSKAPFVAAKNVVYPNQKEIDGIEYYIKNFVWGKLQRTDEETPYSYGVYGTPSWQVNRNIEKRRKANNDTSSYKIHVWRSYDYPHIIMLYYHMYQIASMYPQMTHYLDKDGYLLRAKETAKAFFKYPYEILPWYEIYKWGCYNELLIVNLIADLKKAGFNDDATYLTSEWEKKVKYFIYDDPYPFRSEYAIDATAFESSHAVAKYGVLNRMQPDSNLWYDKNVKRWYSHPVIKQEDATLFMDRQIQANIALRGAIEPAYYFLGSDFRGKSDSYTLSYMSQMGGWAILDYALHFAGNPADYIRLGYQSYLSSFALINSGTPQSNYGFLYPGVQNDGAAGWAFEPQKYATPWIQKPQGRGPWFYDGEIDLGFGGATRMAATVVTNDPVFGMVAYGGTLSEANKMLLVIPKDGMRTRLYYRNGKAAMDILLNRDGFAKDKPVTIDTAGKLFQFELENRSGDAHNVVIDMKGFEGTYKVTIDGKILKQAVLSDRSLVVEIPVKAVTISKVSFTKLK